MKGGRTAWLNGLAAEAAAEALYRARGARLIARRWRCAEGEIDLVLEEAGGLVFAEVKARRDRDGAALALRPAQLRRLRAAVTRFVAERGEGRAVRVDVVLVDRSGATELIENAVGFEEDG